NSDAIVNTRTRALMERIAFEHGGPEYDRRYPDGIPTSLVITDADGRAHDSGLVMYPAGHARHATADLAALLRNKFRVLGSLAVEDPAALLDRLDLRGKPAGHVADLCDFAILDRVGFE